MVKIEAIEATPSEVKTDTELQDYRLGNRLAFTLKKFFEKIEPLVPLLAEEDQLKVAYLKSLNEYDTFRLEYRAINELRLYHHSDEIYQYLCLLWEKGEEGKFLKVLSSVIDMLIRLSFQGPSDLRSLQDS